MVDRFTLTEELLKYFEETVLFDDGHYLGNFEEYSERDFGQKVTWDMMRKQILDNTEKTGWYDDIMAASNEVVKQNLTLAILQDENKQLKELLDIKESQLLGYDGIKEKLDLVKKYYLRQKEEHLNLTGLEKILGAESQ